MKTGSTAVALMLMAIVTGCSSAEKAPSTIQSGTSNAGQDAINASPVAGAPSAPATTKVSAESKDDEGNLAQMPPPKVPDLAAYVGKEPFSEVDGVTYLAHPVVRTQVEKVVSDPAIRKWVLEAGSNPWKPLFVKSGRIVASGCQSHGCDRRSWSVIIDMQTHAARVCFEHNGQSRWYSAEGIEPQNGDCPFDENDFDT